MCRPTILAVMALLAVSTIAIMARDLHDASTFEESLNALTAQIRETGDTSLPRSDQEHGTGEAPETHPWGGAVWLHDGFVTIDKAELGLVNARRPSFTLGFQKLPQTQCARMLSVRGGQNSIGDGVLQVSARNIETGRFVSFKGAELDTTTHQVELACEGSLFTVTVSFDFKRR